MAGKIRSFYEKAKKTLKDDKFQDSLQENVFKAPIRDTANFAKTIGTVVGQSADNAEIGLTNFGRAGITKLKNPNQSFKQAYDSTPKIPLKTGSINTITSMNGVTGRPTINREQAEGIQKISDSAFNMAFTPSAGVIPGLSKVAPLTKFIANTGVRSAEGAVQSGLSKLSQTGDFAQARKEAIGGALTGAALNTVTSPFALRDAVKDSVQVSRDLIPNIRDFDNLASSTQTFRKPISQGVETMINGVRVNAPQGADDLPATIRRTVNADEAEEFFRKGVVDRPTARTDYNAPKVELDVDPNTGKILSWDTTEQAVVDRLNNNLKQGKPFQRQVGAVSVGGNVPQGPGAKIKNISTGSQGMPLQEKLVDGKDPFNVNRLNVAPESKQNLLEAVEANNSQIKKQAQGTPIKRADVIKRASEIAEGVKGISREQVEDYQARLLNSRQSLAQAVDSSGGTMTPEVAESLRVVLQNNKFLASSLSNLAIDADPKITSPIIDFVKKIEAQGNDIDKVLKAAEGVDFNNPTQASEFYRSFVKPKSAEWLDLLRYNSMLSSPQTQINNAFGNAVQVGAVKPVEKAIGGAVDFLSSSFTGKEREHFAGEGGAYLGAALKNIGTASQAFGDHLRGLTQSSNLDTRSIPLATKGAAGKAYNALNFPMKVMEGMDQFFTKLAEAGETGALEYSTSKGAKVGNIKNISASNAERTLYRRELGQKGDGTLSNAIDALPMKIQELRNSDNQIVSTVAKWTLPFVKTPTNILKQGIEYSPAGVLNLPGNTNKPEAVSKAVLGSAVFAGAATLLGAGRLTWGAPSSDNEKAAFYEAGMQPYSVKVGDKWVAYSKLGPLAFPIAMVAAVDDAQKNAKLDESTTEQVIQGLAKYGEFFADQSYLKSIGDLLNSGQKGGLSKVVSNYPQQVIPYRAALGWVARLTDQVQRDPNSVDGSFIDKQLAQTFSQIPGLSKTVPARTDAYGEEIKAQNPILNAVSPLKVTTENEAGRARYEQLAQDRRNTADAKVEVENLKKADTQVPSTQTTLAKTGGQKELESSIKTLKDGRFAYVTSDGDVVTNKDKASLVRSAAIDKVKSGAKRVETDTSFFVADDDSENGYREVKKSTLAKNKRAYDLEVAKRDNDYKTWEKLTIEDLKDTLREIDSLDPEFDFKKKLDLQQSLESKAKQIVKYRSYGGSFKKGAKIKKIKTPKAPKASTPSSGSIKQPTIKQIRVR